MVPSTLNVSVCRHYDRKDRCVWLALLKEEPTSMVCALTGEREPPAGLREARISELLLGSRCRHCPAHFRCPERPLQLAGRRPPSLFGTAVTHSGKSLL